MGIKTPFKIILHVDFNSYFATVEQQANPRLRGKPIGVTGGDRDVRTVVGAASVEAKRFGVKTGMALWEARKFCPDIILVRGDSDKYLACTKRFLNILKDYSPSLEVFSIDECFLELTAPGPVTPVSHRPSSPSSGFRVAGAALGPSSVPPLALDYAMSIAEKIKERISTEVGDWVQCSIGISYNKVMAKLAGSMNKPNGLVVIADEEAAMMILDQTPLDEICGIGGRIKRRLNNMGVFSFKALRKVPKESLVAQFGNVSGNTLYNFARGIDYSEITPFYEKEEVKSIGHRHTLSKDTSDPEELKQLLLKLTELVARRLRAKKLEGKTVSLWFRLALSYSGYPQDSSRPHFEGDSMQTTIFYTSDGLDIFNAAWRMFNSLWQKDRIRMVGVSISNLKSVVPENISLLEEENQKAVITQALDKVNDRYGEFTLQRGTLLNSALISRKANSFLSDRRFKL